MEHALSTPLKALIDHKLLNHSDEDVKLSVSSCLAELARITAPDCPYSDDQMKVLSFPILFPFNLL